MSVYSLVRAVYRWGDRVVLKHVPAAWDARLRTRMFHLARWLFPDRITARSVGEFANTALSRKAAASGLPGWARGEVKALVSLEPLLNALVADGAVVEPYVIPWDMNYVGLRYAAARHQLHGEYACFVLMGVGAAAVDTAGLAAVGRPLAIIDVDGDAAIAQLAQAAGADYLALPAEHLDLKDHCAVLARLVLQLAPRQVRCVRHPVIDQCLQWHGLALTSVTAVRPWVVPLSPVPGAPSGGSGLRP